MVGHVRALFAASLLVVLLSCVSAFAAPNVTVDPNNLSGWEIGTSSTGTAEFVNDTSPVLGCGSFRMLTGPGDQTASQGGVAYAFHRSLAGTNLSDITTLRYWTYNSPSSSAATHLGAALRIPIDYAGDGSTYAEIIFEPVYFNRVFGYQPVLMGQWQGWDALAGRWWSSIPIPGVPLGRNSFVPWSAILTANPNAKVIDGAGLFGGQSSYGAPWAGYDGNIDAVTFGASGNATLYNFESATPPAECGNDTTPPAITCPAAKSINCYDSTLPSNTGIPLVTDDIDPHPALSYADAVTGDACPGSSTITRTWTATDASGNSANCTQTITLNSTQLPLIFSFAPASGPVGTVVTITGANFTGTTAVKIGGRAVPAGGYAVDSSTQITAVVPETAITGKITVTTSYGTATSSTNFTVTSPTITSFTPTSGTVGAIVTITGANFSAVNSVSFNNVSAGGAVADINTVASGYQIVSATQIKARVPNGATTGLIRAGDASGTGASASNFLVLPKINSFSPTSGTATVTGAPGTVVTIDGTTFTGTTAVKFNGLTAGVQVSDIATATAGYQIVSDAQLLARVPANATSGAISVTNAGGTATSAAAFTVSPRITSFTPTSGAIGAIVTITGANFTAATGVTFNGVSAGSAVADITTAASGYQVVSATQIKARVPAGALTGKIGVSTAAGSGLSATNFLVLPTITGFTPSSGTATVTIVTINGATFTGTTAVKFNGVSAGAAVADVTSGAGFQIVSDNEIKARVPASATTGKISVTNAGGTATGVDTFTVSPQVTSFSPTSGIVGAIVTITGLNFTAATDVGFNGVGAGAAVADINTASSGYQVVSATSIKARVPAGAATGKISVTTPAGTGVSATNFLVLPTISTFTPINGVAGTASSPGTIVSISGSTFTGTTAVKFNSLTAGALVSDITTASAGYQIVSDSQVYARVPLNATTGKISVTNAGGTATSVANFTVSPRITSFTPTTGPAGTIVTITGANLTGATAVAFNGLSAGPLVADVVTAGSGYQIVSATQIKAVVPVGATTGKISVTNSFGDSGVSATDFVVTYRINGKVTNSSGAGVANVKITRSGSTASVLTNAAGQYTLLVGPGSYTVTPSLTGSTFSPTTKAVTVTNLDVTGVDFIKN